MEALPQHAWDIQYFWNLPESSDATINRLLAGGRSPWTLDYTLTVDRDPGVKSTYFWSIWAYLSDYVPVVKQPGGSSRFLVPSPPMMSWGLQSKAGGIRFLLFTLYQSSSPVAFVATPDYSPAGTKINPVNRKSVSYCESFNVANGNGVNCLYAYPWVQGVSYEFRTSVISRTATTGDTLQCTMYDPKAKKWILIGTVLVPAYLGHPTETAFSYSDFATKNCSAIPPAAVTFSKPALEFFPISPRGGGNVGGSGTPGMGVTAWWGRYRPKAILNGNGGTCGTWATLKYCGSTVMGSSPAPRTPGTPPLALPNLPTPTMESCGDPPPSKTTTMTLSDGFFVPSKASEAALLPLSAQSLASVETAADVVLSSTGSIFSGNTVGPEGQSYLPARAFLSTDPDSQTPTNATWILAIVDSPFWKMIQIQILLAPDAPERPKSVLVYASEARNLGYYVAPPLASSMDQEGVNEAWQGGVSAELATCISCPGQGVWRLATE